MLLCATTVHNKTLLQENYFKWFGAFFLFLVLYIMANVGLKLHLREQLVWASNIIRLFLLPILRSFSFQNMVYINARAHRQVSVIARKKYSGRKKCVCSSHLSRYNLVWLYRDHTNAQASMGLLKSTHVFKDWNRLYQSSLFKYKCKTFLCIIIIFFDI